MAAVVAGAAALAYRKAVAKTREKAEAADHTMPWLQVIVSEMPEDDSEFSPDSIQETIHHRKSRLLKTSKHQYDRVAWFVYERITSQAWFEAFVMANIIMVGAATGYDLETGGGAPEAMNTISLFTLAVFTLEVVLKVVAEAREPWRYLTDLENRYFNFFDLSIVIASYAFLGQGGGAVGGLRMLRLVRLLTFVKSVPQLRVIIAGLVQGLKSVAIICMLLCLIIYMFAILACLLFGSNDPAHFGTVSVAMLSLFQISTLSGWTNIAYVSWYGCENFLDSEYGDLPSKIWTVTGEFEGFKCNKGASSASPVATILFFSLYILITAWVIMSLFIGVISMGMFRAFIKMKLEEKQLGMDKRLDENSKLHTNDHDEPPLKQKIDLVLNDDDAFEPLSAGSAWEEIAHRARRLSESSTFSLVITATIIIIGVMIGVDTDDGLRCSRLRSRLDDPHANCDPRLATVIIGWIAQAIFTVEVAIKIIAEGHNPKRYFIDQENGSWNCLDFFVVVVGFVEETPAGRKIFEDFPVVILRLLRLIRVFRLAKALPRLRSIVEALISGFTAVGWIFVLIVVFNYIVACMCMLIFQENDPFHFGSLGRSMFTMLKLETLDGWDEVLYLAVFGCANYPAYDYSENNPNMDCKKDKSFGFGWIGAVIISAIVLIGAYVLPTVLIGIVSIKFDEATTYFETARVMRQNTARVVAKAREELPDLLTNARLDDCRTLFDQLDADSSLTLDFRALAPFYHYTFAKLFGVELSPDQGESLYQSMDTNGNADVSFDEFIHFIATIKKIEKRCKNDPVYQNKKFGEDAFKMIKTVTERSKWNGAMARANHESVELAWDEIFTVLNGEDGNSPREKAMSLFRTIDSDKSGEIDEEELILGLASCGCHMTKAQVHSFIADVDSNEDGQLSFEEFVSLITNKIKERDQEKTMRERSETEALVRNHRNRILSPRLIKLAQSFSSLSPSESTSSTSSHSSSLTPPSPTERFVNQKMKHAEEAQLDEMRNLLFPELGNVAHAPASSVLAGLTESYSEEESQ